MTREEAIKILKAIRVYECYPKSASEETKEAIDMAIKALSAPQTYNISRADAIEALRGLFDMRKSRAKVIVECFGELLDALPSAEAVPLCDDCTRCTVKALNRPSAETEKGEWIKKQVFNPELDKYVPLIECSVCGYEPYFGGSEPKFNYCANCGARMEK